jgi:hypothetical protein
MSAEVIKYITREEAYGIIMKKVTEASDEELEKIVDKLEKETLYNYKIVLYPNDYMGY